MTESIVLTLIVGIIIGAGIGHVHSWRLARKLEAHSVRLRDWDAYDWQAENFKAVQRLREAQR